MADDFNTKLNDIIDSATKAIQDGGKTLLSAIDKEKTKAELRAEIGHNARDLTKAYEQLGRDYYAAVVTGKKFEASNATMDLIRSKEKVIELLNDKLDQVG